MVFSRFLYIKQSSEMCVQVTSCSELSPYLQTTLPKGWCVVARVSCLMALNIFFHTNRYVKIDSAMKIVYANFIFFFIKEKLTIRVLTSMRIFSCFFFFSRCRIYSIGSSLQSERGKHSRCRIRVMLTEQKKKKEKFFFFFLFLPTSWFSFFFFRFFSFHGYRFTYILYILS